MEPERTIVELSGDLDAAGADVVRGELDRLGGCTRKVVLAMAGVEFIDSAGVGLLVQAYDRLRNDFCTLAVRDPSPVVRRALDMSGLRERIEVIES